MLRYLFALCVVASPLSATGTPDKITDEKVTSVRILSIAKGGTHLIQKCLQSIQKVLKEKKTNHRLIFTVAHPFFLFTPHFRDHPCVQQLFVPNTKIILNIRDPRAACLSYCRWHTEIIGNLSSNPHANEYNQFKEGNIYKLLLQSTYETWMATDIKTKLKIMMSPNTPFPFHRHSLDLQALHLLYKTGWVKNSNALIIRFEHLVGPKGNGLSEEVQVQEVEKVVRYLDLPLDQDDIRDIAQDLYGNTLTFRGVQSSGWRKYFDPPIIETFKKMYGALLIQLGYEKDFNWQ